MLKWVGRVLGVVLAAVLVLAAFAWYRINHVDVEQITPDVYMLTGIGGNVGVLVTEAGVVVVDTMTLVRQGTVIQRKIAELTEQPIAAVLNTHYHLDHTHGNPAFAPGTKVVATARTLAHLRERDADFWRDAPARDLLPNDTFEDRHELKLGNKTVRSYHLGRGHTDGDLVVLFVEDRVLHAGDLYFNGRYPNIDLEAGGSVRAWVPTIEQAKGLPYDKIIPGHGAVSDLKGLTHFQEFMFSLWSQTEQIAGRGGTLDEALATVDLDRFDLHRLWWFPFLNRDFVIRRAWEEVTKGDGRAP